MARPNIFEGNNGVVADFPDDYQSETDLWLLGKVCDGVFPVVVSAAEYRQFIATQAVILTLLLVSGALFAGLKFTGLL